MTCGTEFPFPLLLTHIAQVCQLGIHSHSLLLWKLGIFVTAASATYTSCSTNKVLQACCKKTHINTASLKFLFPMIQVSWALQYGFWLLHQPMTRAVFSVEHQVFFHWVSPNTFIPSCCFPGLQASEGQKLPGFICSITFISENPRLQPFIISQPTRHSDSL